MACFSTRNTVRCDGLVGASGRISHLFVFIGSEHRRLGVAVHTASAITRMTTTEGTMNATEPALRSPLNSMSRGRSHPDCSPLRFAARPSVTPSHAVRLSIAARRGAESASDDDDDDVVRGTGARRDDVRALHASCPPMPCTGWRTPSSWPQIMPSHAHARHTTRCGVGERFPTSGDDESSTDDNRAGFAVSF